MVFDKIHIHIFVLNKYVNLLVKLGEYSVVTTCCPPTSIYMALFAQGYNYIAHITCNNRNVKIPWPIPCGPLMHYAMYPLVIVF